jgi:uncharacterized membrane protein
MHLSRVTYLAVVVSISLWCIAVLAAPLFTAWSGPWQPAGELLYRFFHTICHQLEGRSFHISGEPLAVCARCFSIYIGFLAGALAFPFVRGRLHLSSRALLVLAGIPMLLDVAGGILGVHEVTLLTRSLTGTFFGVLLPFVTLPVLMDAVLEIAASPSHVQPQKGSPDATAQ